MLDPLPPLPKWARDYIQPLANKLELPIITLHLHEILLMFIFYHFINTHVSPSLSRHFFPTTYKSFNARTRLNWDAHVVSLVQSIIVNSLALWVIFCDEERKAMTWEERIWGYTGASGMVQAFAAGYFLWDLIISTINVHIFGLGMLAHAVCALVVFCLGYRPFVNFYAPTFVLYELSSPFLNFHWFFDKINMTGSRWQLINGIVLLATFFSCRLVWGTYQSVRVYQDVWRALHSPEHGKTLDHNFETTVGYNATSEVMKFATNKTVPLWLALTYLLSNVVLNALNFYWFGKMIEAIRKRFQPRKEGKERTADKSEGNGEAKSMISTGVETDGQVRTVHIDETQIRQRKE